MNSEAALNRVYQHLNEGRFFKLICGGSFSDALRLKQLISAYSQADISAVDVSANLDVVNAAIEALPKTDNAPLLMVSFPLDADPHFRKIELVASACIQCGICVPICPTQVFTLPNDQGLQLDVPVCYGCGRCVPLCPTDALKLDPFSVMDDLVPVLQRQELQAVEIHTTFADPLMVESLYAELGPLLKDKLISICLRPQLLPLEQVLAFIRQFKVRTPFPLIIQVDGEPMSGSDEADASLPALDAARAFAPHLPEGCFLTISGGINRHTVTYLREARYAGIRGVGMGTVARRHVWHMLANPQEAARSADKLVTPFRSRPKWDIMEVITRG